MNAADPVTNQFGDYYERQAAPPAMQAHAGAAGHGGTPAVLAVAVLGVVAALVAIRMGFRGFVIEL